MDLKILSLYRIPILFIITCIGFYLSFTYDLARTDFIKLIGLYAALFFFSFKIIQQLKTKIWVLIALAVIFRLLLIPALPQLSQDYFRFIWDGRLLASGWNPYHYLPLQLIENPNIPFLHAHKLFEGMGALSAGHYTSYPPLNQLLFAVAAVIAGKSILGSVIVLRILIIAADIGTLYFGRKLLRNLNLPEHRIFWYILNPFIIIELTGNLHFEGIMIFFLVLSLYLLHQKKWLWSAIVMGLSISLKLIPLLFLPILFSYFLNASRQTVEATTKPLGFKKLILYYLVALATLIVTFLPFVSSQLISNFAHSIGLWFQKFEFNASIYYLVRWLGFHIKGYNIIATAGRILPAVTLLIILCLSLFRKNSSTQKLISSMLFAISIYFFLATTVHPWYLATPLILSIFTNYKYIIVWTAVIMLSYSAYSNADFAENLWLVALEYCVIFGYFSWEIIKNNTPATQVENHRG